MENNLLLKVFEEFGYDKLFDKQMTAKELTRVKIVAGNPAINSMFKIIYACLNHMKISVIIFHDADPDSDLWAFNIQANNERIIYTLIQSDEEPICKSNDNLAYLIWTNICGKQFGI